MTPRDTYLRRTYGVTETEWQTVLEFQGGHCAVCPSTGGTRALHTDHDHGTGVVRGILCFFHNSLTLRRGLTPETLRDLADYLENPPAVQALGREQVAPNPRPSRRRRRKRATVKRLPKVRKR